MPRTASFVEEREVLKCMHEMKDKMEVLIYIPQVQSTWEKPNLQEEGKTTGPKKDPMHRQAAVHHAQQRKALPPQDHLCALSCSKGRQAAAHTLQYTEHTSEATVSRGYL